MDEYVALLAQEEQLKVSLKKVRDAMKKMSQSVISSVKNSPNNPYRLRIKSIRRRTHLSEANVQKALLEFAQTVFKPEEKHNIIPFSLQASQSVWNARGSASHEVIVRRKTNDHTLQSITSDSPM